MKTSLLRIGTCGLAAIIIFSLTASHVSLRAEAEPAEGIDALSASDAVGNGKKVELSKADIRAMTKNEADYSADSVIVILKKDMSNQTLTSLTSTLNSSIPARLTQQKLEIGNGRFVSMKVPDGKTVEEFLVALNARDDVLIAEPNYKRTLSDWTPNDTNYGTQWQLQNVGAGSYGIQMPKAWAYVDAQLGAGGTHYGGSSTVVVAVIDTGLAMSDRTIDISGSYEDDWNFDLNTEIPVNLWVNSDETAGNSIDDDNNGFVDDYHGVNIDDYFNYLAPTTEEGIPDDDYGHGTLAASIIAGNTNNSAYGAGIAFNTTVMPIKIFNCHSLPAEGCYTYTESIILALLYAMNNDADVINMSYGGNTSSTSEEALLNDAVAAGIIPVAAAGNTGNTTVQYPAGYLNVIAVGASNQDGSRVSDSTYGDWIDLAAPVGTGGMPQYTYDCFFDASASNKIPCTVDANHVWDPKTNAFIASSLVYQGAYGTSFAAPQVAGAAALMKSLNPSISFQQARYKLRFGATKVGGVRYSSTTGFGILDVYGALTTAVPTGSYQPVYRFYSPVNKHHFYTNSEDEKDMIIRTWPTAWRLEGVAYYSLGACPDGMRPLYRFWSPSIRAHFYTIDAAEKDYVIATWPTGWRYEGESFCASPGVRPDMVPVYRFWNNSYRGHFYTIDAAEKDYVIRTWPTAWRYEGVAFYVPPTTSML